MIDYNNIPTAREAKKTLGKYWFLLYDGCECNPCECHEKFRRAYFGDLWTSPSDKMENNVILKAPFTRRYIQAMSHDVILGIGKTVEDDIIKRFEAEKVAALELQEKRLFQSFNNSIVEKIKDAEAMQRATCHREYQKECDEFDSLLQSKVEELAIDKKEEFQKSMEKFNEKLIRTYETKLNKMVDETAQNLTTKLVKEMEMQEDILAIYGRAEIQKRQIMKSYELEKQQLECHRNLEATYQLLDSKNIVNMMYTLCMERKFWIEEKKKIAKYYLDIQANLNEMVSQQNKEIERLEKKLDKRINQVSIREKYFAEIVTQYQKLINYALKAWPTQAQYLLSIQKLMSFDLAEVFHKDKTSPPSRTFPCEITLPWAKVDSTPDVKPVPGLIAEDFHNCLNELAMPKNEEDVELSSFYYKNKLYVREDFRNLISQKIVLTPSHDLWSEAFEKLVETIKQLEENAKTAEQIEEKRRKKEKRTKSVATRTKKKEAKKSKKPALNRQCLLEQNLVDYNKLKEMDAKPCVIAAIDSLELIKQKGKVKMNVKPDDKIVLQLEKGEATDEYDYDNKDNAAAKTLTPKLKLSQMEVKRHSISGSERIDSDIKQVCPHEVNESLVKLPSKIALSRDSVSHLRASRNALLEPTTCEVCKNRYESKIVNYHPIKEYCCDKCLKQRLKEIDFPFETRKSILSTTTSPDKSPRTTKTSRTFSEIIQETGLDALTRIYRPSTSTDKLPRSADLSKLKIEPKVASSESFFGFDQTIKRMPSFIAQLSDQPELLKLFTACQR